MHTNLSKLYVALADARAIFVLARHLSTQLTHLQDTAAAAVDTLTDAIQEHFEDTTQAVHTDDIHVISGKGPR